MAKGSSNEEVQDDPSMRESKDPNNPEEIDMEWEGEDEVGWSKFPLTDECHHYQQRKEVPWDIQK